MQLCSVLTVDATTHYFHPGTSRFPASGQPGAVPAGSAPVQEGVRGVQHTEHTRPRRPTTGSSGPGLLGGAHGRKESSRRTESWCLMRAWRRALRESLVLKQRSGSGLGDDSTSTAITTFCTCDITIQTEVNLWRGFVLCRNGKSFSERSDFFGFVLPYIEYNDFLRLFSLLSFN